jgi:hypothetical protein
MVLLMKRFPFVLAFICLAVLSAHATDFSSWLYTSRLRLNTTASGANVSGAVLDFPVLVRLSQANFDFNQANADGSDLRFSKDEIVGHATELPFQIERWDKPNKLAEIWVKVPKILGNNNTQAIKMYWGNSATLPTPPTDPVFSSSNGFAGAWHLGENPGSTAGGYKDATPAGNNGTGVGGTSNATGLSANGVNFNGSQSITIPNVATAPPSTLHPTGNLSVEVWVNATAQGQYKRMVSKAFSSAANPWDEYDVQFSGNSNTFAFVLGMGTAQNSVVSTSATSTGQWYHVVGTYDQSTMKIYVNGVLENTKTQTGTISDYLQGITFGKYQNDNVSNFNGKIDEVRISTDARNADWVKLSYMNQRSDQKLVEKLATNQFSGTPGILFQKYDGISNGYDLTTLTSAPEYPENPTETRIFPSLSWKYTAPSNPPLPTDDVMIGATGNFGIRMSGWLQAPETGNYVFQLLADDRAELWLSTDADPLNKVRIIDVLNDWRAPDAWAQMPQQKSAAVNLKAGVLYYIEALTTQCAGNANVALGWTLPSGGNPENPIAASRFFLSPNEEDASYPSTISLYERGTSNKKATLGWDNSTGNEHFYLETDGKLSIDQAGISTSGAVTTFNQGSSSLGSNYSSMNNLGVSSFRMDNIPVLVNGVQVTKKFEINMNSTGLDYKVTNTHVTPNAVMSETKITEDGITTGTVTTKKWKIPSPDYVFEPGYKLRSLAEVEAYVKENKHLPEVPSAKEMESEGVDIGTMNMRLLKKVEELTLHVIEMDKEMKAQRGQNQELKNKVEALSKPIKP